MRLLGIDPGTGICGFAVLELKNRRIPTLVDCGVIKTPPHTPLAERLTDIYQSLQEVLTLNQPDLAVIEKLFFTKNITTGISVAEARGVVLLALQQAGLNVYEYTPSQIKKTITGFGNAKKQQMQEMVRLHLGMSTIIKPDDAADAVAIALTHIFLENLQYGSVKPC